MYLLKTVRLSRGELLERVAYILARRSFDERRMAWSGMGTRPKPQTRKSVELLVRRACPLNTVRPYARTAVVSKTSASTKTLTLKTHFHYDIVNNGVVLSTGCMGYITSVMLYGIAIYSFLGPVPVWDISPDNLLLLEALIFAPRHRKVQMRPKHKRTRLKISHQIRNLT